jgi:transketolase
MVLEMAEWPSAVYLRALRADVPVIYGEGELFPFGKFKVVKKGSGKGKKLVIAANGYLVHTALKAAASLERSGIDATVVDAYCLPFDAEALLELAGGGAILTVEDNYVGGIGSEIAEAAARSGGKVRVEMMNVRRIPKSGKTPEDVLAYVGLSEGDVVARAGEVVGA